MQLLEAKRQQRKLNFLITQTEIFAHFMANKVGSASTDENEILEQLDEKQPLPVTTIVDDYDRYVLNIVWKFENFSVTQILREIRFGNFEVSKTDIFTFLAAQNVEYLGIFNILR